MVPSKLIQELDVCRGHVKALTNVLDWYSDPDNWKGTPAPVWTDLGKQARVILSLLYEHPNKWEEYIDAIRKRNEDT